MADVLMLLKCNGLEYDDRVRKECLSLLGVGLTTEIHVIEDSNSAARGEIYSSGSKFVKHRLMSRRFFSGNKFLLLKLIEFFFRIYRVSVFKRRVVWLHDPLMFVFVPYFALLRKLNRCDRIVWDQHELPPSFMIENPIFRRFYISALSLADVRVHANVERGQYLNDKLGTSFNFDVLNNFVDEEFANEPTQELPSELKEWLENKEFVLLQSGAYHERCFDSVAKAIALCDGVFKCVVVGGTNIDFDYYRKEFPDFDDKFYFVGMVPQIRLVDYIDRALVSLILYQSSAMNSWLCEPNRLYQALCRGTRVIVGNNPTMKNLIENSGCGTVLPDDGSNCQYIHSALMKEFSANDDCYPSIETNWSSQKCFFDRLITII